MLILNQVQKVGLRVQRLVCLRWLRTGREAIKTTMFYLRLVVELAIIVGAPILKTLTTLPVSQMVNLR